VRLWLAAFVVFALAGCHSQMLKAEIGHRDETFLLVPDPACADSDRAPLAGLGDAQALLMDVSTDRRCLRLLDRMTGDHPLEVEVVAPTTTSTEAYLQRAPSAPAPAAVRIVPEKLELKTRPKDVEVRIVYGWGQACLVSEEIAEEPQLSGDRARAFDLALEYLLLRRAKGWTVAGETELQKRLDAEIAYGHHAWPK
jgi:hypothetical protein